MTREFRATPKSVRLSAITISGICLLLTLFGCAQPDQSEPLGETASTEEGEPTEAADNGDSEYPAFEIEGLYERGIGIGDVNYAAFVSILLNKDSKSDTVEEIALVSPRFDERVVRLELKIAPPYPTELWMDVVIGHVREYPDCVVTLDAHIKREYRKFTGEADKFETVKEEITLINNTVGPTDKWDFSLKATHRINVLEGLDEIPQSILIHALVDARIYKNTTLEGFDPSIPPVDPKDSGQMLGSNPVRIYFLPT